MRDLIAVLSVFAMILGLIGLSVSSNWTAGPVVLAAGAVCFTIIIAANDIVVVIQDATKAMNELRKANEKQKP